MAQKIVSPQFSLVEQDWKKIFNNALVFAGPALLVLLASLADVLPKEGVWMPIILYILNILTDAIRKYISANTYK